MKLIIYLIVAFLTLKSNHTGLVWAELGTMFPDASGNEFSYIMEAFTPWLGFVSLFTSVVCLMPMSVSIITLVCGDYILTAFGDEDVVHSKVIAAAVICKSDRMPRFKLT